MARTKKEKSEKLTLAGNTDGMTAKDSAGAMKKKSSVMSDADFIIQNRILLSYKGRKKHIVIPDGVRMIGANAFRDSGIRSVKCPDSLEKIGIMAFAGCYDLSDVRLNDGLIEIGNNAFEACYSLEDIEIPDSVQKLGAQLFLDCEGLMEVTLPRGLKSLPDEVFGACVELAQIHHWPTSLKKHGMRLFEGCFEDWMPEYFKVDGDECVRVVMDPCEIDPSGVFNLSSCSYAMSCVYKLWNLIYQNALFDMPRVEKYMEICRTCLFVSATMTDLSEFSAMQTVRTCFSLIEDIENGAYKDGSVMHDAILMTLNSIGGNGTDWKKYEDALIESIFHTNELIGGFDEKILKMAEQFRGNMLTDLGVQPTLNRYHPNIFHHTAWIPFDADYWHFLWKLEGLMRFLGIPFTQFDVECDLDDGLDGWLKSWSEALKDTDYCLVRIEDDMTSCEPNSYISVMLYEQAQMMYIYFKSANCESMVDGWIAGRKLFTLTLV